LHLAFSPADTESLDRHQLTLAGGLKHIRGGGEFLSVEFLDDLAARGDQIRPGDEDGLMNDRASGTLFVVNRLDCTEGIMGLFVEAPSIWGNRNGHNMPDVVELDDRVAATVSVHSA
jgi:hypothetical protein